MKVKQVTIIGSGMAGAAIAHLLTKEGYSVELFEKGPEYPYLHAPVFEETQSMYEAESPSRNAPSELKNHTLSGSYTKEIEQERYMHLGGSATHWEAITLRMRPADFRRESLFGYAKDWPISYEDLEAYYSQAEHFLGVSGTDDDNPFAPPRSKPHPLPPFPLSYDDTILAERLAKHKLLLHSTPQARASQAFDGRSQCLNYKTCRYCPIGARYSPNHHLQAAQKTDLLTVHKNTSIRKIILDKSNRVRAILYRENQGTKDIEHPVSLLVLAAGGLETPRLLLLSKDTNNPDGIGNRTGHVGQHFTFHHIWRGRLRYKDPLFPGRFGGWTGQSHQFLDPEEEGTYGGTKIEFSSNASLHGQAPTHFKDAKEVLKRMDEFIRTRHIAFHTESVTSDKKYLKLSDKTDRFGDPFIHIHYESSPFDHQSFLNTQNLLRQFEQATKGEIIDFAGNDNPEQFDSGCHHMGACRMSESPEDGVVNSFGQIHGTENLFLAGSSIFVGTSGPVNPTLSILALALRTGAHLLDQKLPTQ